MAGPVRLARVAAILGLAALGACSTQVQGTSYVSPASGPMPRPDHVVVKDFVLDPGIIQVDQGIGGRLRRSIKGTTTDDSVVRDAADIRSAISDTLVEQVQSMGLQAELFTGRLPPGNVVVIQGQVNTVNEGNQTRRNVVGFGAGQSSVSATAQVLYVPSSGQSILLQTYQADSNSGRMPGLAAGGVGAAASGSVAGLVAGGALKAATQSRSEVGRVAGRMTTGLSRDLGGFFAQQGWIPASAVPSRF